MERTSSNFNWSETLLEKCKTEVDWNEISKNSNILWTIPMLKRFERFLNWTLLSENINETFIRRTKLLPPSKAHGIGSPYLRTKI